MGIQEEFYISLHKYWFFLPGHFEWVFRSIKKGAQFQEMARSEVQFASAKRKKSKTNPVWSKIKNWYNLSMDLKAAIPVAFPPKIQTISCKCLIRWQWRLFAFFPVVHSSMTDNMKRLSIAFNPCMQLRGDILIKCYHHKVNSATRDVIFRCQFHTCAISDYVLNFTKSELDDACEGIDVRITSVMYFAWKVVQHWSQGPSPFQKFCFQPNSERKSNG